MNTERKHFYANLTAYSAEFISMLVRDPNALPLSTLNMARAYLVWADLHHQPNVPNVIITRMLKLAGFDSHNGYWHGVRINFDHFTPPATPMAYNVMFKARLALSVSRSFLFEVLIHDINARDLMSKYMIAAYTKWADKVGQPHIQPHTLKAMLNHEGFEDRQVHGYRVWRHVRINKELL